MCRCYQKWWVWWVENLEDETIKAVRQMNKSTHCHKAIHFKFIQMACIYSLSRPLWPFSHTHKTLVSKITCRAHLLRLIPNHVNMMWEIQFRLMGSTTNTAKSSSRNFTTAIILISQKVKRESLKQTIKQFWCLCSLADFQKFDCFKEVTEPAQNILKQITK